MALLKVTAANALPTVRQLIGDLKKVGADAGALSTTDSVNRGLDNLDGYCAGRFLDVELLRAGAVGADTAGRVAAWIGKGLTAQHVTGETSGCVVVEGPGAFTLRVQSRAAVPGLPLAAGAPRAPILIVVSLLGAADEATRKAVDVAAQDRPLALVLGPPLPAVEELHKRVCARAQTCERQVSTTLQEEGFGTFLSSPPWDGRTDVLRALSAAAGLESLVTALTFGLEAQTRETRVRRQVTQQRLARFQTKGPSATPASAPAELLSAVKSRLQRMFSEFERGASDRLQELLGYPAGSLTREIEGRLNAFAELEHEERSGKLATRVPAAFEQEQVKFIRERVGRHLMADVVAINDLFRLLGQEIERMLAEAEGPPLVLHFDYLTEERVRKLLLGYASFQSAYRGEMARPGFEEYFASVRKYAMLLVMGASMFGLSSYVRLYREYTIPLTVLLVLFGTASVVTSTRTERAENMERELEMARTAMRPELKRILSDIQKQWTTTLAQYLAEQAPAVLELVDGAFKAHQVRRESAVVPERDRLQRQIQAMDALDKRLPQTTKARDVVSTSLAQVRGDLRQALTAAPAPVAGAAARPAAGAGPAAASLPGAAATGGAAAAAAAAAAAQAAAQAPSPARERMAALQAKMAEARGAATGDKAEAAVLSPARQKLEALKAKLTASKAGTSAAPAAEAKADAGKSGQAAGKP
jgi:hypothetical protein